MQEMHVDTETKQHQAVQALEIFVEHKLHAEMAPGSITAVTVSVSLIVLLIQIVLATHHL
tara:strand:+ start:270 stop:449 length:180 start_codon:yes stop_codon:yes gene_type:complete